MTECPPHATRCTTARWFGVLICTAITVLLVQSAKAGPKLRITLEAGTERTGQLAADPSGAVVTAEPLLVAGEADMYTSRAMADAEGIAVLEVGSIAAYRITIRLEGASRTVYWSTRRVLLDEETELIPGGTLSINAFSPIEDYGTVGCSDDMRPPQVEPIKAILHARLPVLLDELSMHIGRAREIVATGLDDAPDGVRKQVETAIDSLETATETFLALTPIRQKYGLAGREGTTGHFSRDGIDLDDAPDHAIAIETLWLFYFAASGAEVDIESLYARLKECDLVGNVADASHTDETTAPDKEARRPAPPQIRRKPAPTTKRRPAVKQHRRPPPIDMALAKDSPDPFWSGLYVGVHAGAAFASANYRAGVGALVVPINVNADGFLGGVLAGYNWQADRLVFGVETDVSLGKVDGGTTIAGFSDPEFGIDILATMRARVGYAWDDVLLFVSAGLGVVHGSVGETLQLAASTKNGNTHVGFVVGTGLEWAVSEAMTLRAEYIYGNFSRRSYTVGPASDRLDFELHLVRAAVTINMGALGSGR